MQIVNDKCPALGYGCAINVNNCIFAHGGLTKRNDSGSVSNNLCKYDARSDQWINLTCPKSPALSYHASFVAENRYIYFVGGWNGKSRTSDLHVYDTHHSQWLSKSEATNFPVGAGLSSHTVTPLENGDALIIGRLGGLKTQRRTASVFLLKRLDYANFEYREMTSYHVTSRSGHTSTVVAPTSLVIIGGREGDDAVEHLHVTGPLVEKFSTLNSTNKFTFAGDNKNAIHKWPSRKYHCALPVSSGEILLFGGESCAANISAKPLDDCWMFQLRNSTWKKVTNFNAPTLSGHQMVTLADGQNFVIGGFDKHWISNNLLYKFTI